MGGSRARVVWFCVDRLELFSRDTVSLTLLGRLMVLHAAGRKEGRVAEIEVGGERFEIAHRQARHGALLLRSDHMVVALHPGARGLRPRITFELGSRSLSLLGPAAVERARAVLRELAEGAPTDPVLHVSRIDLAADVQGWSVRASDLRRFVTRARRVCDYEGTRRFTGFTFGRKALLARIYDKTTEIGRSGNTWVPALWEGSPRYRPGVPVWRIEFQARRTALRSFARLRQGSHLDTWEEVREAISALWGYLTTRWLSFRGPRSSGTRQTRAAVWERVLKDAFAEGPWSGNRGTLSRVPVRVVARPDRAALQRCILREVAVRRHLGGRTTTLADDLDAVLGEARVDILGSPREAGAVVARHLARFRDEERGPDEPGAGTG